MLQDQWNLALHPLGYAELERGLVRGICGSLMRSNGGRKLGSPGRRTPDSADSAFCVRAQLVWNRLASLVNATAFCRCHPRLVPLNTQSGILCDPASLVLYGRCKASSRPPARSRKGESRRTLSEPFSPFEPKLV